MSTVIVARRLVLVLGKVSVDVASKMPVLCTIFYLTSQPQDDPMIGRVSHSAPTIHCMDNICRHEVNCRLVYVCVV
jgi:hypothetical protein